MYPISILCSPEMSWRRRIPGMRRSTSSFWTVWSRAENSGKTGSKTFSNFFEMSGVINKAANTSKAKNKRTEALKDMQIESQIKGLIKVFETDGKIDVICHSGDKTFIIPSKKEFFTDGKGDVIRTGNFRMLGKIVKICSEKENISLLRDTKIGKIKSSILDTAIESFNNPEIKNVVDFEPVVTNYDNAILVYPIAIYI